jgi:hypothetical protein
VSPSWARSKCANGGLIPNPNPTTLKAYALNATATNLQLNDHKKRRASDSLILGDDDSANIFPTFLVVEAVNGQNIDLSIFAIQKLLKCAVGDVKNAKKLRNGTVLVEVVSKAQTESALTMHIWISTPVKVTPHRSLNTSKSIIRCREMRDCSDEVLEALSHEGVTHIKHIFTKKNGSSIATSTFILTFNKPIAPKSIRAVYQHIPVEPFIPNLMRCFDCHALVMARVPAMTQLCAYVCSKEGHCDADCSEEPHCTKCSGSHSAFSKECPE